jgi:hypothetical protein
MAGSETELVKIVPVNEDEQFHLTHESNLGVVQGQQLL